MIVSFRSLSLFRFFFSISLNFGFIKDLLIVELLECIIHDHLSEFSNLRCKTQVIDSEFIVDFVLFILDFFLPGIMFLFSSIKQNIANVCVWFDTVVEISDQVEAFFSWNYKSISDTGIDAINGLFFVGTKLQCCCLIF